MKYRKLGRTGLKVSEVGLGCWAIGGTAYGPTRDEESLQALETAWERGVNFFDTADTYGHGHSELLVGEFLKDKPREKIIVASKVGWDFYHGGNKKNFDPAYIRFACEESLKRLGIPSLDLYQLHNPSLEVLDRGEALEMLENLKREGKIRFAGVSIHREEEGVAAIQSGRVDTLQVVFNLLNQRAAERLFDMAMANNIGLIVREPLAFGFLTGKYKADHEFPKDDHRRRFDGELIRLNLKKVDILRRILATERLSLARAALEYVLQFEQVSTVIPGAKTPAQVLENTEASYEPMLRIEEAYHLRELCKREKIFREGIF